MKSTKDRCVLEDLMDPTTLATIITNVLTSLLIKMSGEIGKKIGNHLPDKTRKIWDLIFNRFQGKPTAEGVLKDFSNEPTNEKTQDKFRDQLEKELAEDMDFFAALNRLLKAADKEIISNVGSGAVAKNNSVAAGAGGIAISGNVTGNAKITLSKPHQNDAEKESGNAWQSSTIEKDE